MNEINLYTNTLLIAAGEKERSLFTKINFPRERTVSFDYCRKMLSDPEEKNPPEELVLDLILNIIEKRLRLGLFTVVDIPQLTRRFSQSLLELCNRNYYHPCLVYFSSNNVAPGNPLENRFKDMGFADNYVLKEKSLLDTGVNILPVPALCQVPPPYDIIGDVHGCFNELTNLFSKLGYENKEGIFIHPAGRIPIFLGDVADRGPKSVETIRLVLDMVRESKALYIPGNHCVKLSKYLEGGEVKIRWGIETTIREIDALDETQKEEIMKFPNLVDNSARYLILDKGKLVVTHAAIKEKMIGREHKRIRRFCLFGASIGNDHHGLPIRLDWAAEYRGKPLIVYGHTPVDKPELRFNTINIDQGCVFGGALTALRYPEMETVSVPAERTYYCRKKKMEVAG